MASKWQPAHSLVEDAISEAEIAAAPCLPALVVVTCLPLCLGRGPICSQLALLWYSLNPSFCKLPGYVLEPFTGELFFFFLWESHSCYLTVSSLRLSSRHSDTILTLQTNDAACTSLPRPHLLVADVRIWATSLLAVVFSHLFCVFVCVFVCLFVFSRLCCSLRFQYFPQTHWWESLLVFRNFFTTPSWGWISIPKSFVSLFVFYILPYLLLKRMGCLVGCLSGLFFNLHSN